MKKTLLATLALTVALSASTAFAQSTYWTPINVRAMGMGSAFCGVADDVNAVTTNPAGLGFLTRPEATVSYYRQTRDYNYGTETETHQDDVFGFAYETQVGPGSAGFAFSNDSYSNHVVDPGFWDYTDTWSTRRFTAAYGQKLSDHISLGFAIENTSYGDPNEDASTGFSLGALYQLSPKLTAGWVLGTSDSYDCMGVSYKADDKNMVAFDFDGKIGIEHKLTNQLSVRAGVDSGNFCFGAGYKMSDDLRADYAHVSPGLNAVSLTKAF